MFKRLMARLQVGQAIIEYMPTIAGAMALASLVGIAIGGGVTESYCKVVDGLGDRPDVCAEEEPGTPPEDPAEEPDESDDPVEATCILSLASADGEDWNTKWSDGETDTLIVTVEETDESIPWSLTLSFPNDVSKPDQELGSGSFEGAGTYEIEVEYPAEGDWGVISPAGDGRYNAKASLDTGKEPCPDKNWTRYYEGPAAADVEIKILHDLPEVTGYGDTLTYTMTVTNHGPYNAGIKNGQGTLVQLPIPSDVTVLSAIPSQGRCDMSQIACDLGELKYKASATITVITSVDNPDNCSLKGDSTVSVATPEDPDLSNNQDDTTPGCNLSCTHQITSLTMTDTTNPSSPVDIANLGDGSVIRVSESDRFNVRADFMGDVDYVKWMINGRVHVRGGYLYDYTQPYNIMADIYSYWDLAPGYYTVQAYGYKIVGSKDNMSGGRLYPRGGADTYCTTYEIGVLVEDADPNDPLQPPCTCIPPGQAPDDPDDPNDDPDQPREAEGDCPDEYPIQIARYDHYATAANPTNELRWGISGQQSHTYTFDMPENQDVVLVLRSAVGHPELNCPDNWQETLCVQPNQDNEHWRLFIDGVERVLLRDNGAWDHVYLKYPDINLGTLAAGSHTLTMEHAGLLDTPTNSYTPSVGALTSVCAAEAAQ